MKATTKTEFQDLLYRLGACKLAQDWVKSQPEKTARELLRHCKRGDWLMWLLANCGVDRRIVVFVAAQCARQAVLYTQDSHVKACLVACERWSRGKITDAELHAAKDEVNAAVFTYRKAGDAAAYASWSVGAVADAMSAKAVIRSVDAIQIAAHAACFADGLGYAQSLATSANLVRKHIPWHVMSAALRKASGT